MVQEVEVPPEDGGGDYPEDIQRQEQQQVEHQVKIPRRVETHPHRPEPPTQPSSVTVIGGRTRLWREAIKQQFWYSMAGLVVGVVCILGGITLFVLGVTGSLSWSAKILGSGSELVDAAPGALLFVVGLFIIFVTRYSVKGQK